MFQLSTAVYPDTELDPSKLPTPEQVDAAVTSLPPTCIGETRMSPKVGGGAAGGRSTAPMTTPAITRARVCPVLVAGVRHPRVRPVMTRISTAGLDVVLELVRISCNRLIGVSG